MIEIYKFQDDLNNEKSEQKKGDNYKIKSKAIELISLVPLKILPFENKTKSLEMCL